MRRIFCVFLFVVLVTLADASLAQQVCGRCGGYVMARPTAYVGQGYAQQQRPANVAAMWGSGRKLEVAYRSASYRAARGIRGHASSIERGYKCGVGWSTGDSTPRTCFWGQRNQGAYVSVRGRNGYYYSTLIL